jgi:hypothetical protein
VAGKRAGTSRWRPNSSSPRAWLIAGVECVLVVVLLILLWSVYVHYTTRVQFDGMDSQFMYNFATQLNRGEIPYRDFPFEYPPLAILPIALPGIVLKLAGSDAVGYAWLLAAENVAFVIATGACLIFLVRRGWSSVSMRRALMGYGLLIFATPYVFWRFDAFAALVMMLALVAFAARRPLSSGLALGVGLAVKVFPIAIAPVLVAAELFRRDWSGAARIAIGAAVAAGAVAVIFWLGAGTKELSFLEYHADRGVQLESVLASIGMVAQLLGSHAGHVYSAFGAWQLQSPFLDSVPSLGGWIAAAFIGLLIVSTGVRFGADVVSRGDVRPETLVSQLLATVIALTLVYRVFSPQFLIWLLPLAALRPRAEFWCVFVICLLTLAIYPLNYEALMELRPAVMLVLIARNGLMVGLLGWLVVPATARATVSLARGRSPFQLARVSAR